MLLGVDGGGTKTDVIVADLDSPVMNSLSFAASTARTWA